MSIVQKFTFNPFQENTYIIYDETKACVIIDPGCYDPFEQQVLTRFITENELTPVHLLNTHCHIDHVVGNSYVASTYHLQLTAHPEDNYNLERLVEVGQRYGVPVAPSPPADPPTRIRGAQEPRTLHRLGGQGCGDHRVDAHRGSHRR